MVERHPQRSELGRTRAGARRRRRAAGPGVLAALALAAAVLSACSSTPARPKAAPTTTAAPATTTTAKGAPLCPLTGAPVPGGGPVPQRAALAVKVDNYPSARPQSGLDKADIIFEEPVEAFITRYVAVFQCQEAPLVGPIRSARNIDVGILGQLGTPLEAHVGGIPPVLADIDNSPIVNVDLGNYGSIQVHPANRVAPYDTYASTQSLWATHPTDTAVPAPLFSYSAAQPQGTPVSSIAIPFSSTSNVVWRYDPSIHAFQRYYGTTPDILADGVQDTAANVVVQFVNITYGPWYENDEGGLEVQANLYQDASGKAEIFRSGVEINGTWSRDALGTPTKFVNAQGGTIPLQPGQTWVELVPSTIPVTTTPAG